MISMSITSSRRSPASRRGRGDRAGRSFSAAIRPSSTPLTTRTSADSVTTETRSTASTPTWPGAAAAQAMFPEDSARRVVILTDGNENLGDALHQANACSPRRGSASTSCRLRRPERRGRRREGAIPADIRRGQPFDSCRAQQLHAGRFKRSGAGEREAEGHPEDSAAASSCSPTNVSLPPGKTCLHPSRGNRLARFLYLRGRLRSGRLKRDP